MRILMIEDEPLAAERLHILLQQYDEGIKVLAVLDSVASAIGWLSSKPAPDLILMDIELADGKCFPLLQHVHPECPVVFTTAYDQFALDAFQHLSLDYLLKPVSAETLARALNRFNGLRKSKQEQEKPSFKKRFLVKNGTRMQFVGTEDISYFFADGKQAFVVMKTGQKYPVDLTLEKLESMLDPGQFFRFSRKVIGSVDAIRDIRQHQNSRLRISLHAGPHADEAIVSRERVQAFREWAETT
jgi:DNA-binding LytR/AlgR family response regulator